VVVKMVGALREQHRRLAAQDERHEHRRVGRCAIDDAALAQDLGLPGRWPDEAQAKRRRIDARRRNRGKMRIRTEDGDVLGLERKAQASFSLMRADLPERLRR
jgi:hypothetical protein